MKEISLYPCVEKLLSSDKFGCFKTKQKAGTSFVGQADVVGVRDIGGDMRGDLEVIAVEVKKDRRDFGKILGQALGYSLFAHKCYLGISFFDEETFSLEQKEMATRLGVGLLDIRKYYGAWSCTEVLTSANHVPLGHQMETVLRKALGLFRCSVCGFFVEANGLTHSWRRAAEEEKIYRSWRTSDRNLLFSRRTTGDWRRVHICSECVRELSKVLPLKDE